MRGGEKQQKRRKDTISRFMLMTHVILHITLPTNTRNSRRIKRVINSDV
jgi:hypothetical protein